MNPIIKAINPLTPVLQITDGYFELKYEAGIDSARLVNSNVWKVDLSKIVNLKTIPGLRVNGRRAIRAKYPNGDPEESGTWLQGESASMGGGEYIKGWITWPTRWIPSDLPNPIDEIIINNTHWPGVEWPMNETGGDTWTGEGDWGQFHMGMNGYCSNGVYPPIGYWCAANPPRHIETHQSPDGVVFDRAARYSEPSTGVINAWRGGGRWYTWQWQVTGFNSSTSTLSFDKTTGRNKFDVFDYVCVFDVFDYVRVFDIF